MALRTYNTFTKAKQDFVPNEAGKVKMYVCGPTVYDYLHIGNFRGAIFFNLVSNWLKASGYEVTYVYNYTDVDDKIINRALEEKVNSSDISERFIKIFEEDFNRLGLTPHDHNPKVTEYIPAIIKQIEQIIDNGHAYVIDGEVLYEIESFTPYGSLSGKKLEDLNAGERVDIDQKKRAPGDFVLWKPAKPGEPFWESPWGPGRPGWHIECSAMIHEILGPSIDIHGGGIDLIFPHHENEIAQGEAASKKTYCNCWMHNNFINLSGEKMSKSLGNVMKARTFMDLYHPEVLKYLMLSLHYRSPLDISDEKIVQAVSALARVYKALSQAEHVLDNASLAKDNEKMKSPLLDLISSADKNITKALNDDFNTGEMMGQIFEVVRAFNALNILKKKINPIALGNAQAFKDFIQRWGSTTALFQTPATQLLKELDEVLIVQKKIDRNLVDDLIEQRGQARKDKNWQRSDEIRDQLLEMEIELHDSPEGTKWEVKK